jgi:DNA repair protein RecO (recombination protein O)
MLTGVHSKKSGGSKKLIQPLSLLSIDVYYKSSRELQKIKEYKPLNPLRGIHSSIVKTTIGLFIAEILYRTIKEEEKNVILFSFLINSIEYLDLAEKGVENFHLVFLILLSKYLGFFPNDNFDSHYSHFNIQIGTFSPFIQNDQNLVTREVSVLIQKLMKMNYSNLDELEISGSARNAILDKLILYYQAHSEGLSQLKSHKVLQEVFSGNNSLE